MAWTVSLNCSSIVTKRESTRHRQEDKTSSGQNSHCVNTKEERTGQESNCVNTVDECTVQKSHCVNTVEEKHSVEITEETTNEKITQDRTR